MPWSSVTRIQAAPIRSRYSCAWSRTLARSRLVSRRSRNWGTRAETWLRPARMRVRAARKSVTARRVFASARWIDSSAVRFARSDVTPNVAPSTATTSNAEPRKILAASPNRTPLVPLAPGIRRIVLAVLVLVRHPVEAAGIELDRDVADPVGDHHHVARDLRAPVVPHVPRVAPRRHACDGEAAVGRRLRVVACGHHLNERHHTGVDVAEHAHQAGAREGVTFRLAPPVPPQVERIGLARGENVVLERVVVRELHRRAERHDRHPRYERLVAGRDLERLGARRGGRPPLALEVDDGIAEIGGRRVALLQDGHPPADHTLRGLRHAQQEEREDAPLCVHGRGAYCIATSIARSAP